MPYIQNPFGTDPKQQSAPQRMPWKPKAFAPFKDTPPPAPQVQAKAALDATTDGNVPTTTVPAAQKSNTLLLLSLFGSVFFLMLTLFFSPFFVALLLPCSLLVGFFWSIAQKEKQSVQKANHIEPTMD